MLIASGRLPPHHSLSVLRLSLGQDLVDRTDRAEYGRRAKMRRVEPERLCKVWAAGQLGSLAESGSCARKSSVFEETDENRVAAELCKSDWPIQHYQQSRSSLFGGAMEHK